MLAFVLRDVDTDASCSAILLQALVRRVLFDVGLIALFARIRAGGAALVPSGLTRISGLRITGAFMAEIIGWYRWRFGHRPLRSPSQNLQDQRSFEATVLCGTEFR